VHPLACFSVRRKVVLHAPSRDVSDGDRKEKRQRVQPQTAFTLAYKSASNNNRNDGELAEANEWNYRCKSAVGRFKSTSVTLNAKVDRRKFRTSTAAVSYIDETFAVLRKRLREQRFSMREFVCKSLELLAGSI
jgi:hypothetical protein